MVVNTKEFVEETINTLLKKNVQTKESQQLINLQGDFHPIIIPDKE